MPTYDRRRPVHSAGGIAVQAVGDAGKVDDWKLGRNDGSGKFCRELAEVVTSGTIYLMLSPNAGHEARQMRRSVPACSADRGVVLWRVLWADRVFRSAPSLCAGGPCPSRREAASARALGSRDSIARLRSVARTRWRPVDGR